MITLAADCLVFQMASGESIPYSAEMISVELMGDTAELFDAEFVRHASHAVFHYFKKELGRTSVTVGEFSLALEKVLKGFVLGAKMLAKAATGPDLLESDLGALACESGKGCELFFFPRLREELARHLEKQPRVVRFRGLRRCVKQLVGARRWTPRCQDLKDEIVQYLRTCVSAEPPAAEMALVVE